MAFEYLGNIFKSTFLDIEYLDRIGNSTFAFTLNAEKHFLFLNQMQFYAYQVMFRCSEKAELSSESQLKRVAEILLVKKTW